MALTVMTVCLISAIIAPKANATANTNAFISKVYPINNDTNKIYVDTKSDIYDVDSFIIDIDGKKTTIDFWDLYVTSNAKKQEIELPKKFTANSNVKVYVNYTDYGTEDYFDIVSKTILIDTLKVGDKVAPKVSFSTLSVRTTQVTLTSEKNAKLTATYNGKKIALKKASTTKWTTTIKKPLKGKKLVVTAKDAANNTKKYTKTTVVPTTVLLNAKNSLSSTKKLTGTVKSWKSTDKVQFKVGSKTYKATVKKGKFTINYPKTIATPKKVSIQLIDRYGNVLDKDSARIYKYKKLKIGMTTTQAANTLQGKPADVSKHKYSKYTYEYWTYYDGYNMTMMVSFENGKIDSISKF